MTAAVVTNAQTAPQVETGPQPARPSARSLPLEQVPGASSARRANQAKMITGQKSRRLGRSAGAKTIALLHKSDLQPSAEHKVGPPLDPAAAKAYAVLETHCARCHQSGRLRPDTRPAAGFGNILHLAEMKLDPRLVHPGNPDGSLLYTAMIKRDMPYDVLHEFKEGKRPTVDEISAIRDWIEGLRLPIAQKGVGSGMSAAPMAVNAGRVCKARRFISNDMVASQITDYVRKSRTAAPEAEQLRFVTLTNLYNACATPREMSVYRHAIIKLLNSLSLAPRPLKLNAIDDAGVIIAFKLSDLGWDDGQWNMILARYPYGARPRGQKYKNLVGAAANDLLSVRADWFSYAATRAPLYADLLRQPGTARALAKKLQLSIEANIRSARAQRFAFTGSSIAANNRVIERHKIKSGYFWTSYDFSSNKGRRDLANYPLGPIGKKSFRHQLNAVIYSLPNGFPAFFLNDDEGRRVKEAPPQILRDAENPFQNVAAAASCLSCHGQGVLEASDTVIPVAINKSRLSQAEITASEKLYIPLAQMNELLSADVKAVRAAFKNAGLQTRVKRHGVESITALAKHYSNAVGLHAAAAEFGLSPGKLVAALQARADQTFGLRRRLAQGTIPRRVFNDLYAKIMPLLQAGDGADAAPASRKISVPIPNDAIAAVPGSSAAPVPAAARNSSDEPAPNPRAKNKSRSFQLSIYSDKSVYRRNDSAQLWVSTTRDCNLTLINVDTLGRGTVIFPNDFRTDNAIKSGQVLNLPGSSAPYKFKMREIGSERIIGICNVGPASADGIEYNFEKQKFQNLGDYRAFINNALGKEWTGYAKPAPKRRRRKRRRGKQPDIKTKQNKTPLIQARTGIIIDVR